MITFFVLLAIIGLGQCHQYAVPTRSDIELSINRTIEEVERMINEDPSLPRLSRQEILDILNNITTKDLTLEEENNNNNTDSVRSMHQKALMVVLPYSAKDSVETLKDLYTKPPMVQMIADSDDFETISPDSVQVTSEISKDPDYDNTVATYTSTETTTTNVKENSKQRYKNHRETYSEVHTSVPEIMKTEKTPLRFSFNLENLQKSSYNTHKSGTVTRRPVYYRYSTTRKNEEVTTMSDEPEKNNNDDEEISIDLKKIEYTTPASKTSQNVLTSDQWKYFAPPSTTSMPITTTKTTTELPAEEITEEPTILTTIRVVMGDVATEKKTLDVTTNNPVTWNPKKITKIVSEENPGPAYVTPEKSKYSSTYSLNAGGFRGEVTSESTPMRKEVEELLASIGLQPGNTDNIEDIYRKNNEIFESGGNKLANPGVSGLTTVGSQSPSSISSQNTFEYGSSDIRKGMDNLTPDVQLLFQRFGIQTSQQHEDSLLTTTTTTTTTSAPTNLNYYTNFKPLPTSRVKDQEMKDFLAQFGLGISDTRGKKAMKASTERPSLIEAVPQNLRKILQNIGLISRVPTTMMTKPSSIQSTASSNLVHVFKPHEAAVSDEKQRIKINELLDTVKMVQRGTADVKDVQKIADDLLKSAKTLKTGPDPVSLEEIFKLYGNELKNEVKRQQNQTEFVQKDDDGEKAENSTETTTLMATATTESATDLAKSTSQQLDSSTSSTNLLLDSLTSSATTESVNIDALVESFGGSTAAPDPVLPMKRRNGFYFLVDWNSFLEVGEEDKDKVNLRFQPQVGDRSRFIPVNVP